MRSQSLIVLRDLLAEILRFDFEERFRILLLEARDKEPEESSNQIRQPFKHG
jgi:hypothetical protein